MANQTSSLIVILFVHITENLNKSFVTSVFPPSIFRLRVAQLNHFNILRFTKLAQRHSLNPGECFAFLVTDLLIALCLIELFRVSFKQTHPFNRSLKEAEVTARVRTSPLKIWRHT